MKQLRKVMDEELLARIKVLEERIRILEARPEQHIHYHTHPTHPSPGVYPSWPGVPYYPNTQPWWINPVTCGGASPQIGTIAYGGVSQ